tara:strand:+ start:1572 stop:1754 length:183 start_codon:yes stop_codon:yes gene_type:complete
VLFGRIVLTVPGGQQTLQNISDGVANADVTDFTQKENHTLGRVSIGWTLGEDVLFNDKRA